MTSADLDMHLMRLENSSNPDAGFLKAVTDTYNAALTQHIATKVAAVDTTKIEDLLKKYLRDNADHDNDFHIRYADMKRNFPAQFAQISTMVSEGRKPAANEAFDRQMSDHPNMQKETKNGEQIWKSLPEEQQKRFFHRMVEQGMCTSHADWKGVQYMPELMLGNLEDAKIMKGYMDALMKKL